MSMPLVGTWLILLKRRMRYKLMEAIFWLDVEEEKSRMRKWILHYYWNNENLMFKDLIMPKLSE
jgi:hypothetical protein